MRELVLLPAPYNTDPHWCPLHVQYCMETGIGIFTCPMGPHEFTWRETTGA